MRFIGTQLRSYNYGGTNGEMVSREFLNEDHPPPSRVAHVIPQDRRPNMGTSRSWPSILLSRPDIGVNSLCWVFGDSSSGCTP